MRDLSPQRRLLAASLKAARARSGLSQTDLAEKLNVPQSWVSNIETGTRRLDLIEAWLWADAVGADISELRAQVILEDFDEG